MPHKICSMADNKFPYFKAVAKDHLKSLVRSSTCLVILDFFHFTPLVLIGKKIFFFLKLEARLEAVIFSYPLKCENFIPDFVPVVHVNHDQFLFLRLERQMKPKMHNSFYPYKKFKNIFSTATRVVKWIAKIANAKKS